MGRYKHILLFQISNANYYAQPNIVCLYLNYQAPHEKQLKAEGQGRVVLVTFWILKKLIFFSKSVLYLYSCCLPASGGRSSAWDRKRGKSNHKHPNSPSDSKIPHLLLFNVGLLWHSRVRSMAPEPVHSSGAPKLEIPCKKNLSFLLIFLGFHGNVSWKWLVWQFLSMRREHGRVTLGDLPSRMSKLKMVGDNLTEEERASSLIESYQNMEEEVDFELFLRVILCLWSCSSFCKIPPFWDLGLVFSVISTGVVLFRRVQLGMNPWGWVLQVFHPSH